MGLEYYYKIFVVELGEVYSAGSNEISAKTDYIRTYPFYDDMEDELTTSNNWDLYTWGEPAKYPTAARIVWPTVLAVIMATIKSDH